MIQPAKFREYCACEYRGSQRQETQYGLQHTADTEMYSARPYRFDHWIEPVVVSCPQQRRCGRQWDREEGQKHLSFPFLPPAFGPHPALCGSLLVSNRHVLEGRRIKFFPQVQKPLAPLFPRLGFLFFSAYQWVFCEAGICLCVFTVFVCSSIKVDEQGRFWVSFWHKDTTQGQTDLKVKIICSFVSYQHVINVITFFFHLFGVLFFSTKTTQPIFQGLFVEGYGAWHNAGPIRGLVPGKKYVFNLCNIDM